MFWCKQSQGSTRLNSYISNARHFPTKATIPSYSAPAVVRKHSPRGPEVSAAQTVLAEEETGIGVISLHLQEQLHSACL